MKKEVIIMVKDTNIEDLNEDFPRLEFKKISDNIYTVKLKEKYILKLNDHPLVYKLEENQSIKVAGNIRINNFNPSTRSTSTVPNNGVFQSIIGKDVVIGDFNPVCN